MRLGRRLLSSPTARTVALIVALEAVAIAALLLVVPSLPVPTDRLHVAVVLLAVGFLLGEAGSLHLRPRGRDLHSYTFNEVPLVMGLAALSPGLLLAARLVGAGVVLVGRGQRGIKLAFNLAHFSAETALAVIVFRLVLGGQSVVSVRGSVAALAAVLVIEVWGVTAVSTVIGLRDGRWPAQFSRLLVAPVLSGVVNAGIAVLAVSAVHRDPRTGVPLGVFCLILFLGVRSYNTLSVRHGRLQRLHTASEVISCAVGRDATVTAVIGQAAELLRARRAELVLHRPEVLRATVLDGAARFEFAVEDGAWWSAPDRTGRLVGKGSRGHHAELLRAQGLTGGVAVGFGEGDSLSGVLWVADRVDRVTSFDPDDLAMLTTLAAQAATAVANSWLVDQLRREGAQRLHDANHDPRTGLPNRRGFALAVDGALECGQVAVLLLDLDNFKDVNDVLGHAVGDDLLRLVAARVTQQVPAGAITAHLGGDELAVVLPVVEPAAGDVLSHTVQEALRAPFFLAGSQLHVSASFGLVHGPVDGDTADLLLQRADLAMYAAKAKGGNAVEVYGAGLEGANRRRLEVVGRLQQAVQEATLRVVYQPQIDLVSGRPVLAEALARWTCPVLGPVGPDEFIPLAEQAGLMAELTELVLSTALGQAARWATLGHPIGVAVNLSPRSLHDPGLVRMVLRQLHRHGVPSGRLTFEVTETAVMEDVERSLAALHRLVRIGVRLSIDDFGTGHSSLAYLKSLPVTEVKIDRAFVLNMVRDRRDAAIVRSTISLAHDLGLSVVAEGVEDADSMRLLCEAGCDVAQGFGISRPLEAADFADYLTQTEAVVVPMPRKPRAAGHFAK